MPKVVPFKTFLVDTNFSDLYEDPSNYGTNEDAWRKAKDMYASCMNIGKKLKSLYNTLFIYLILLSKSNFFAIQAQFEGKIYNVTKRFLNKMRYNSTH